MGLGRQCAVTHGPGGEPAHDLRCRLHVVERHRYRRRDEIQQVVGFQRWALGDQFGESCVLLGGPRRDGGLQDVGGGHFVEGVNHVLGLAVGLAPGPDPKKPGLSSVGSASAKAR